MKVYGEIMIWEIVVEEFVAGIISSGIDSSKCAIKEAIKVEDEKRRHQSIHTQIYRIIVDALNSITNNTYENNQGKIYDAAEVLLKELTHKRVTNYKMGLKCIFSEVSDALCEKFKSLLYKEICHQKNAEVYNEIMLRMEEKRERYTYEEYAQVKKALGEIKECIDGVEKHNNVKSKIRRFCYNKKQDYIDNWNSRLSLHQGQKAQRITLADAFVMPDYEIQECISSMGMTTKEMLDKTIDRFIKYRKTSTMLLCGEPGIGKSSIVSWLANKYKYDDRVIILRFRDWECHELECGLLNAICTTINCKKSNLENKILILDGFDEMKTLNSREILLSGFFDDILDFTNIKFIMTSRPGYLDFEDFHNVIKLLPFSDGKMKKFYKIITNTELDEVKMDYKNQEILGIPVILYMAIMSGIDISKNATKPELYSRIFAKREGIFDKFCHDGVSYDEGAHILRNSRNVENYLNVLREIAFKMFENNSSVLSKGEYQVPKLTFQGKDVSILEFPIKYLFENTKSSIEFIHKSIYEYFVSEYIFTVIRDKIDTQNDVKQLAGVFGEMLAMNHLSKEICEFLKYRLNNSELNSVFETINQTFQKMLQDGMLFYTSEEYKMAVRCEMNVFANMLDVLHLWDFGSVSIKCELVKDYLCYRHERPVNLSRIHIEGTEKIYFCLLRANLRNANLGGLKASDANLQEGNLTEAILQDACFQYGDFRATILTGANMRNVDLKKANLKNADLIGADLREADLSGADLKGALLVGANLNGAILTDAIFCKNQTRYLEKKYDMKGTRVYIEGTGEIVKYENLKNY